MTNLNSSDLNHPVFHNWRPSKICLWKEARQAKIYVYRKKAVSSVWGWCLVEPGDWWIEPVTFRTQFRLLNHQATIIPTFILLRNKIYSDIVPRFHTLNISGDRNETLACEGEYWDLASRTWWGIPKNKFALKYRYLNNKHALVLDRFSPS